MIVIINQHEVIRCSGAIRNVRLIASLAKRTKRIEAVQTSEEMVRYIDLFRKYCQYNTAVNPPSDEYTAFKHDAHTLHVYVWVAEQLPKIKSFMTKEFQESQQEHVRQVELLLDDIVEYLDRKTRRIIDNGKG